MVKVITYGTYDMLHYGHIRLLERARELGDYLIVGVTAEDYDLSRGKINVQQSLAERMEAVRATGLADEIIVEEYVGQKIDDIRRYGVDIFTIGSDWRGKFDYLNEYCRVVYLERTQGISSSDIRSELQSLKMGFVGTGPVVEKYKSECGYVNGLECSGNLKTSHIDDANISEYIELLNLSDAVFLATHPDGHYREIRSALDCNTHVLCESPLSKREDECDELLKMAQNKNIVLMDAIKTAHATAFSRLMLLAKSGVIGKIVSVDASCSGVSGFSSSQTDPYASQGAMDYWGPTAFLPILKLLGSDYRDVSFAAYRDDTSWMDLFVRASFVYEGAMASFKVGRSVKTEGELVVSGTTGYIFVPAPWWKTDYFEVRRESTDDTKRYFYQLDGEGIRNQLLVFSRAIEREEKREESAAWGESVAISCLMERYYHSNETMMIN